MKNKGLYFVLAILGAALCVFALLVLKDDSVKKLGGICLGIGSGTFGMSIAQLFMLRYYQKHPNVKKQAEVDYLDERNTMIRNRAKAKSADIVQWLIIGVAFISVLMDAPLWFTLVVVGVFISKSILELYLMNKFQREM
jgi:hypothetical protein